MIDENVQFALSQYADGQLADPEKAAVDQLLTHSAEARQMLAEYRRLNSLLAQSRGPLPEVNWQHLAEHISRAVDQAASAPGLAPAVVSAPAAAAAAAEESAGALRIRPWLLRPWAMALAASVLLASGLVWLGVEGAGQGHSDKLPPPAVAVVPTPPPARGGIAEVQVLQSEAAGGVAISEIQIGPSPAIGQASLWQLYPDAAEHPASVSIAGGPRQIFRDEPYAAQ